LIAELKKSKEKDAEIARLKTLVDSVEKELSDLKSSANPARKLQEDKEKLLEDSFRFEDVCRLQKELCEELSKRKAAQYELIETGQRVCQLQEQVSLKDSVIRDMSQALGLQMSEESAQSQLSSPFLSARKEGMSLAELASTSPQLRSASPSIRADSVRHTLHVPGSSGTFPARANSNFTTRAREPRMPFAAYGGTSRRSLSETGEQVNLDVSLASPGLGSPRRMRSTIGGENAAISAFAPHRETSPGSGPGSYVPATSVNIPVRSTATAPTQSEAKVLLVPPSPCLASRAQQAIPMRATIGSPMMSSRRTMLGEASRLPSRVTLSTPPTSQPKLMVPAGSFADAAAAWAYPALSARDTVLQSHSQTRQLSPGRGSVSVGRTSPYASTRAPLTTAMMSPVFATRAPTPLQVPPAKAVQHVTAGSPLLGRSVRSSTTRQIGQL